MDAIKKFRSEKNMTQVQLAALLGVNQSFIAHLESGERSVSPEKAIEWERITKGELPRTATRPDLWPVEKAS